MVYSKIQDFRQVFLSSVPAAQHGKNYIDSYLNQNDVARLSRIMRHHDEGTIRNKETYIRDNIDYFIEYFSLLCIAHITGYLSAKDIFRVAPEITYYLGNAPIKRYYYKNYPLLMPQVLLEIVRSGRYFQAGGDSRAEEALFEKFYMLNQTIDNDDVNQFLWFLDGGSNDDYDLYDLNSALRSYKRTIKILQERREDALGQSVRGFFDYLEFLEQFRDFLNEVMDSVHRAAYWYYHEYWFTRMKRRLSGTIRQFFLGLEKSSVDHILKSDRERTLVYLEILHSQDEYQELVNELILSAPYKTEFETFVRSWRSGENTQGIYGVEEVPIF